MLKNLERIIDFLKQHHLLTLATTVDDTPQVSNLFYAFDETQQLFIVASDLKTKHIQNILKNSLVACSVALETDEVGKIQGVQCRARMYACDDVALKKLYFKAFPYAKVMSPQLWCIVLEHIKLTDNRLGFGKKLIWERELFE